MAVISIIIPALNEERALPACLDALVAQTLPVNQFEVIVVDNGSVDRTLRIARSFESLLPMRIVEKDGCSIAALRNLGAKLARANLLAFLDADCIAKPNWLSFALHILEERKGGVFGAGYQIPENSAWVARAWYGSENKKSGRVSYISGGNLIVSREEFLAAGGFDENLETSEDWEFCRRAASRAIPIHADPNLAVVHLGTPQTLREFYRKQYWHGTHALKAVIRSANGFRGGRAAWFAVWTLLSMCGFLLGLTATALGGGVWVMVAGTASLLAAPIVLSGRTALARSNFFLVFPLMPLYLAYGTARALCLTGFSLPRPTKPVVPDSPIG
jgi:glycosyltransferase involved in cell wall biosynthesis